MITLHEILVWFDWCCALFLSPQTTSSYTFQTWGKIVMFEIGIAALHQTLWDLFWGVHSSGGGYHISWLVNRLMSQITHITGMFLSSNFLYGYQIERVVMELPCIRFALPTGIMCRGAFVTDCPWGAWCHGLTTCSCILVHLLIWYMREYIWLCICLFYIYL